ncbi:MAG: AAA family ATPase [Chloroflexota bacterium]|nr:AAA family ATPase [Chloroflexota bacterium]
MGSPVAGVDATVAMEAEQSLLGTMFMDQEALSIGLGLPRAAWSRPVHGLIIEAMRRLNASGLDVDLSSVSGELEQRPFGGEGTELAAVGGFSYLVDVGNSVPTAANATTYAEQVRQAWMRRELQHAAGAIASRSRDGSIPMADLRASLTAAALALDLGSGNRGPRSLAEVLVDRYEDWQAMAEGTADLGIGSTGFSDLDRIVLPWQPGDVIVLSADNTGRGKTSLAMQITLAVAAAGGMVHYASVEMSEQSIADRVAVQHAALDLWRLRRQLAGETEWAALTALFSLPGVDAAMIDDSCRTTWDVAAHAQMLALRSGPLAMIVVDHLHQLSDHTSRGEDTTASRMAGMVGRLKALAMDMHCPLLLVAQTGRRGRTGADPELNDLRDSAAIEDIASVVMFIRWDKTDRPGLHPVRLLVRKNRNGQTGTVHMAFDAAHALFHPRSVRAEPPARRGDDPDRDG